MESERDVLSWAARVDDMTSIGVSVPSLPATLLNAFKDTLVWRLEAEREIRRRCADYVILRAGVLVNAVAGRRAVLITQRPLPLSIRYRIARGDVARAIVTALAHPNAARATFDVAWGRGPRRSSWPALLDALHADDDPVPSP